MPAASGRTAVSGTPAYSAEAAASAAKAGRRAPTHSPQAETGSKPVSSNSICFRNVTRTRSCSSRQRRNGPGGGALRGACLAGAQSSGLNGSSVRTLRRWHNSIPGKLWHCVPARGRLTALPRVVLSCRCQPGPDHAGRILLPAYSSLQPASIPISRRALAGRPMQPGRRHTHPTEHNRRQLPRHRSVTEPSPTPTNVAFPAHTAPPTKRPPLISASFLPVR